VSNAAGKRHMGKVAKIDCIACGDYGVHVHHIRTERIKSDFLVIPLCPKCHTGDFSIHNSKEQFTNIYGSELHLLAETLERLA
jgi:hypothetical protein